jgi:RHS repeat-associated protein
MPVGGFAGVYREQLYRPLGYSDLEDYLTRAWEPSYRRRITTGQPGAALTTELQYDGSGARAIKRRLAGTVTDTDLTTCSVNPASCVSEQTLDIGELYEQVSEFASGTCDQSGALDPQATHACTATERTHQFRIYAGGRQVAQVKRLEHPGGVFDADQTLYLHDDRVGSTSLITDTNGAVAEQRSYTAFGEPTGSNFSSATGTGVLSGFTGLEHDDGLGLVNMRGRLYDPHLGRFVSADPFVSEPLNPQGFNRYSYVQNRPLNFVDPSGFDEQGSEGDTGDPPPDSGSSGGSAPSEPPPTETLDEVVITGTDVPTASFSDVSAPPGVASSGGGDTASNPGAIEMSGYDPSVPAQSSGRPQDPGNAPTTTTQATEAPVPPGGASVAPGSNGSDSNGGPVASNSGPRLVQWNPNVYAAGSDQDKISTLLGLPVGSAGLGAGIAEHTAPFFLVQGGKWRGLNGNWYSLGWGGNGATGARSLALEGSRWASAFGKGLFYVGAGISLYQGVDSLVSEGNPSAAAKAGVDLGISALGLAGPGGAAVAGSYWLLDVTVGFDLSGSFGYGNQGADGASGVDRGPPYK